MIDQSKVDYDVEVVRSIADKITSLHRERGIAIVKFTHQKLGDRYDSVDVTISSGKSQCSLNRYAMLGFCLWNHTDKILIIHNHPNEICRASEDDVWHASDLKKDLKKFNITLLDSVIVTKNDMWSIAEHDWKYVSSKEVTELNKKEQ